MRPNRSRSMNLTIPTTTFPQSLITPRGSGHAIIDIDLDGVCADYITAMRTICAKEFKYSRGLDSGAGHLQPGGRQGLAHQGQ